MNGLSRYPFTEQKSLRKSQKAGKLRQKRTRFSISFVKYLILLFVTIITGAFTTKSQPYLQPEGNYITPPIAPLPVSNIMGYAADGPVTFDLTEFFTIENEGSPQFEVSINSFPNVAQLDIDGNILYIMFSEPGQTNIRIQATLDDYEAEVAFVIGVMPVMSGDYGLADFSNLSLPAESFWNGSDESGGFESSLAFFPNSYNADWGVWSGWAHSNISDNTTPGWLNQYSAITGSALDSSDAVAGIYAVSFVDDEGTVLSYNNPSAHEVKGMFVTNATFAALSMMYGDDFAKKFGGETGDDPDWFKLTVTGMRNGEETEAIVYYLADYRFEDNTQNYIIQTWQWVELSSLGKVDSLVFTLSSSDVGDWGMNTPAYFAADHFFIVPDMPPVVTNPMDDITVDINAEPMVLNISEAFTDPDDDDQEIEITEYSNSNPELVTTQTDAHELTLTFIDDMHGEASITLEATSNGKTVTESFTVTVLPGTFVADLYLQQVNIFPNPSQGFFTLEYNGTSKARLNVVDLAGKTVYHDQINPGSQIIEISSLPAGIYFLRFQTETDVQTIRIVKQ